MQGDREHTFPANDRPELRESESSARRGIEKSLGIRLPDDYVDFVSRHDGVGGFIGKSYVQLFPLARLVDVNQELGVDPNAPTLLVFASDGAGELYAFDKRTIPLSYVQVPMPGLAIEEAIQCAWTFAEFLTYLESGGLQTLFPIPDP